jgi:hypothetical protein
MIMFGWKKRKVVAARKIALPDSGETFDLAGWKSNPKLAGWVTIQFADPTFRSWFNMIRNEMPQVYPGGIATVMSPVAANLIPGYQRCLEVLADSARYAPMHAIEEPPMTYPDPSEDEKGD